MALQAANQDPSLLDQISKNVTRQGITPATLNYLRVITIIFIETKRINRNELIINFVSLLWLVAAVVRDFGTDARAHVAA